jgi:hypothetical protein
VVVVPHDCARIFCTRVTDPYRVAQAQAAGRLPADHWLYFCWTARGYGMEGTADAFDLACTFSEKPTLWTAFGDGGDAWPRAYAAMVSAGCAARAA